jgi:hypothetical protein
MGSCQFKALAGWHTQRDLLVPTSSFEAKGNSNFREYARQYSRLHRQPTSKLGESQLPGGNIASPESERWDATTLARLFFQRADRLISQISARDPPRMSPGEPISLPRFPAIGRRPPVQKHKLAGGTRSELQLLMLLKNAVLCDHPSQILHDEWAHPCCQAHFNVRDESRSHFPHRRPSSPPAPKPDPPPAS